VNQKINGDIATLWSDYLGLRDQTELAMRYFNMTNALFYTRISYHNLNYEFLHQVASEAKTVFEDLIMSELTLPNHHTMRTEFINEADRIYAQRATS
jgi:hypothetical protein